VALNTTPRPPINSANAVQHVVAAFAQDAEKASFRATAVDRIQWRLTFTSKKCRNIVEYNRVARPSEQMPRLFVFHDEISDWMMDENYRDNVTTTAARLGNMGRAAGIRRVTRNVKRWRNAGMALRWVAAGMIEANKGFRRLKAHKQLSVLRAALQAHHDRMTIKPVAHVTRAA
jgi:hypothetical protein